MKISHLNLSAFYACSQTLNVSLAAMKLGLTQSALSQRLAALENELEITLFIRDPKGLILTKDGEKLLRYAEQAKMAEDEILLDLKGKETGGTIRVAGYSSIMRSKIIPTLSPLLRKHDNVQGDFQTYEMIDIPKILETSRADFILLDYRLNKKSVIEEHLFDEEYVVIESAKYSPPSDIYLDHAPQDSLTDDFFKFQKLDLNLKRNYMGDIYGIIQGVEEGIGRAVMSRHLIEGNKKIKIVKGFRKYLRPVVLHYYERAYYPRLHQLVISEFSSSF
jgi:LysR family transcriptional regulator (chromosome initiation inhibitor)